MIEILKDEIKVQSVVLINFLISQMCYFEHLMGCVTLF